MSEGKPVKTPMSYKTIRTADGTEMTMFEGKLHNWEGPSIKYPKSMKKQDEYYIYGFRKSKEEWKEAKKNWVGESFTSESGYSHRLHKDEKNQK